MSMEKRLKREYELATNLVSCPSSLDERIGALYHIHIQAEGRQGYTVRKFNTRKMAAVALAVVLLTGFAYSAQKLLFSAEQGTMNIEMRTDAKFVLTRTSAEDIRHALADVQQQLAVGQAAVVYVASLEKEEHPLYKRHPLLGVTKQEQVQDAEEWNETVKKLHAPLSLPRVLPDSFTFSEGKEGNPYESMVDEKGYSLLDELRQESKQNGNGVAWRVVPGPQLPFQSYTTTYKNADNDRIYVTVEVMPDMNVTSKGLASESVQYEELDVQGAKAHYTVNDQFLFSESNRYQELFWMSGQAGQQFILRVASDSPHVTKEQLLQVATGLK
ncbi:hypothetical protein LQV63_13335 [Paenibacillus profundus]|uniref:DUF4367 domain-containing protein n=1 Tax=Paenibacillus profundus TaxID=1173085 RepID=A0ABS8YE64_9BACL|nr:hypothetical protein [Paenibacillus profundus]MCE5170293.1 hypothetical protein [Paenibacillus profundus]